MNTTIFLVRHGSIDNPQNIYYGRTISVELTEQGKKELEIVAELIRKETTIQSIYTSPLKRAVDSAYILKDRINPHAEITIEEDFNEVDIPALVNKPTTLRDQIFSKNTDEYTSEFVEQGNESREEVTNRMLRGFRKVVEENKGNSTVIISHGDPIRFLLFTLMNPKEKIPSMHILIKNDYLERGEAWKIVVNEKNEVVLKELLTYRKI